MWRSGAGRTFLAALCLAVSGGGAQNALGSTGEPAEACLEVLSSNCNASQEEILDEFLRDLEIYSITKRLETFPGEAPAFEALPKDSLGMINWIKAVTSGIIDPRGTLGEGEGEGEEPVYEGFYDNLILIQVNVRFMADVVFPHGMHTYWLSCDSCHPEPFKKKNGANNITMTEIIEGKWCGKCHGKVAFPPGTYKNCRRCHSISKSILRKNDG